MKERKVRVAVVQSAPVLCDKASAIEKIASFTKEAGAQGAQLVVFPEVLMLSGIIIAPTCFN